MELNVEEIMEILPHRYPMLLVDKITELVPMDYAVGVKSVTMNEPFFQGHFPGHPVMPGALICEAMAQVGGVALQYPEENRGLIPLFTGMDHVRFRSPVLPGDQMVTKLSSRRSSAAWARSTANARSRACTRQKRTSSSIFSTRMKARKIRNKRAEGTSGIMPAAV